MFFLAAHMPSGDLLRIDKSAYNVPPTGPFHSRNGQGRVV